VIARALLSEPRVLLLDEPTRGIDVGAKAEIYSLLMDLAASGMALVVVSSDLPEVLGISDRVLVMSKGRVTGEFDRQGVTPEKVMECATA
jgi:ABC-type sugar transport system ATPase subunit